MNDEAESAKSMSTIGVVAVGGDMNGKTFFTNFT